MTASVSWRKLPEQQLAVQQPRALAKTQRFRLRADAEGFPSIPGRYGQIEWFDGQCLAVHSKRRRLFEKRWAIPGVKRHQTGDVEMRSVLPLEALEHIAMVIRARRRRTQAPAEARRRGFKPTPRVTSDG